MNLFVDTNILLDVLANRKPFYAAAARIWSMAERSDVQAFISAISFNNIYYILRKAAGRPKAMESLRVLRDIFEVVQLDSKILNQALDAEIDDFEDAVQFYSAVRARARYLLTWNPDDFPEGTVSIITPQEFLAAKRSKPEADGIG